MSITSHEMSNVKYNCDRLVIGDKTLTKTQSF